MATPRAPHEHGRIRRPSPLSECGSAVTLTKHRLPGRRAGPALICERAQAVTQASTVLARGAQEVSHELFGAVQERMTKTIDAMNRIVGVRSVQDFVAVQSELARDNLQQVIETNRRVAEVSL